MSIDDEPVDFRDGETIYDIATRCRREVPSLCYDPRLEPFGACRLCVVDVEGIKNPVASCTTKATDGMVVRTKTKTIEKYRKTLLEMVASENRNLDINQLSGYSSQEDFSELAKQHSEDSVAENGGDRGVLGENSIELRRDLKAAAFSLKSNQVSEVLEDNYAFYLIKAEDKKPGKLKTLGNDVVKET